MQLKFNPTVSFDGIAFIVACAGCCLWLGRLEQRVTTNEKVVQEQAKIIDRGMRTGEQTAIDIATIKQILNDKVK